jgi:hypothetical protein
VLLLAANAAAKCRPTSFCSPWQNGHLERLIGSIRRECTDHLLVFSAEHLIELFRNTPAIIMRYALTFRLGRTPRADVRSSDWETLSRNRSLAGYIIVTCESDFSEATGSSFIRQTHPD